MTTPIEAKKALSVQLDRSQMESQRAAREHAVADKLLVVLRKATRHLKKNPLETLDVRIGSMEWNEQHSECVALLVAKALSSDFAALTGQKPGEGAITSIYESTIPGLYIRQTARYPLTGKYRSSFALVGKNTH